MGSRIFSSIRAINTFWVFLLLIPLAFVDCAKQKKTPAKVLARVGEKFVTLNEFTLRTNLTPRPPYCRNNQLKDKKIALNSFIAEKILAYYGEQDPNISQYKKLNNFLQGIKEQTMRFELYRKHALEKIQLREEDIAPYTGNFRRNYEVELLSIPLDSLGQTYFKLPITTLPQKLFEELTQNDKVPVNKSKIIVSWKDALRLELFNRLYLEEVNPGFVIGPVYLDNGEVIIVKILSWKTNVVFSEIEKAAFQKTVMSMLKSARAHQLFTDYIARVMDGKVLQFNPEGIKRFVNTLGPIYFKNRTLLTPKYLTDPINQLKWGEMIDSLRTETPDPLGYTVCLIDGRQWTARELIELMKTHPLVFRQRAFPRKKFGEQLKLAIVDLIRNYYLTREAYKKGLDSSPNVKETVRQWKDYFLAVMEKEKLFRENPLQKNRYGLIPDSLLLSLQRRANIKVQIDTTTFHLVELNNIQTFAIQKHTPYPVAVPGFPLITDSGTLFVK